MRTTQRPAFQRLLQDIAAGKIDAVAVYKLDRLIRSINDFVRMMHLFDEHGVSLDDPAVQHLDVDGAAERAAGQGSGGEGGLVFLESLLSMSARGHVNAQTAQESERFSFSRDCRAAILAASNSSGTCSPLS